MGTPPVEVSPVALPGGVEVLVERHGDVPRRAADRARTAVGAVVAALPGPVLGVRVRLTQAACPSGARPASAEAAVDVGGRLVRARAGGPTPAAAVDLLAELLAGRLDRAGLRRTPAGREGAPAPRRLPPGERRVVRRAPSGPPVEPVHEAVFEMDALGHRFRLFTDTATGFDTLVYRAGPTGYRLARTGPAAGAGLPPAGLPVTVSEVPAPRTTVAEAVRRLEATGLPFVFFTDAATGRGAVLHHRSDGHYGLVTPTGGPRRPGRAAHLADRRRGCFPGEGRGRPVPPRTPDPEVSAVTQQQDQSGSPGQLGRPDVPVPSGSDQPGSPAEPPHAGDIGRRAALRRRQLGLSREQVASRAGMAVRYLQYVEERPAQIEPGALLRLAGALQTTAEQLRGGDVGLPPGRSEAAARPELEELGAEECRTRLDSRGVGRVAFTTDLGISVLPVNYAVDGDRIVYRTAAGAAPAAAIGQEVAFEVDQVDDALSQGWSVLATGRAERVTDPDELRALASRAAPRPWAGGDRDLWIRIAVTRLTGRVVRAL
ncbi:pyridoxamine 5'-phosphate oxidase family protein [Streptacidiphilus sp. ASG 303]|uniref:pyridoxamine 5'-phosphate oxidase family protein n=1 Tax=Streptacidiphilus sp. ASG 303 TaxID=2896847 RepID=UPI001E5D5659|nr:pyridoxamine 5'-phosphate oxidase family protein [Streptacidiphilus sp. ASG 303]MCD0484505.1 pyridoxamine 5'-phosphate oxidase family protein [Streptacidiphilus sp. ASG 303]